MMNETKFLVGRELTDAIRWLLEGDDVKCAVAFWGKHNFDKSKLNPKRWKIICDIHMGATSEESLKSLGAPTNQNLRYEERLHAKVYISDRGVVIGSANASAGGLGYGNNDAKLHEAGIFSPAQTDIWNDSLKWFDERFSKANRVDDTALAFARKQYQPRTIGKGRLDNSFLKEVAMNPARFSEMGVCFLFTNISVDEKEFNDVAKNLDNADFFINAPYGQKFGPDWGEDDMRILEENPNIVVFDFETGGKIKYSCHHVVHKSRQKGLFVTEEPSKALKLPNSLDKQDRDILRGTIKENADCFYIDEGEGKYMARCLTAKDFARRIQTYLDRA